MTRTRTMSERYDEAAARYGRWWAPVLAPTVVRFVDEVAARLGDEPPRSIVDVGTGTGTLARAVLRAWPAAAVTAVDGSSGMLTAAEREAAGLTATERDRLRLLVGRADTLPLPDGGADLIVSSFVYQLVPNRHRALVEARRVLRPGGMLGFVTWLEGRRSDPFAPDAAFDEAVADADVAEEEIVDEARSGDLPSIAAAIAQTRRAGFRDVRAHEEELAHDWTAGSYLEFVEQYHERDLFASLDEADRSRLREAARRRFARLRPTDFHWRVPVVVVTARRS